MGMDIYLRDPEIEARRKRYRKTFRKYVALRDQAEDKQTKERYQRKVWEWYERMFCGRMGYFRVNYNDYSISYWLECNIGPEAKAAWGIDPFYSASLDNEDGLITGVSFHKRLLKTAREWYQKALEFKDKESIVLPTDYQKSSLDTSKWVKKQVTLKPEQTNSYIEHLEELVDSAELAVKTQTPIEVSA
jgi:hypothetical protein